MRGVAGCLLLVVLAACDPAEPATESYAIRLPNAISPPEDDIDPLERYAILSEQLERAEQNLASAQAHFDSVPSDSAARMLRVARQLVQELQFGLGEALELLHDTTTAGPRLDREHKRSL